jgi:hypothetical protein
MYKRNSVALKILADGTHCLMFARGLRARYSTGLERRSYIPKDVATSAPRVWLLLLVRGPKLGLEHPAGEVTRLSATGPRLLFSFEPVGDYVLVTP